MYNEYTTDNLNMSNLGSFINIISNSQVLSNLPVALQDPPHVISKGRPKSLRQNIQKKINQWRKENAAFARKQAMWEVIVHRTRNPGN